MCPDVMALIAGELGERERLDRKNREDTGHQVEDEPAQEGKDQHGRDAEIGLSRRAFCFASRSCGLRRSL